MFVDERWNVVALHPPVIDAVRQEDSVPCEAIAADVRALPGPLLVELLAEGVEERSTVAGAAPIVLPVRAGEEESGLDLRCLVPGVDVPELFVVSDVEPPQ